MTNSCHLFVNNVQKQDVYDKTLVNTLSSTLKDWSFETIAGPINWVKCTINHGKKKL